MDNITAALLGTIIGGLISGATAFLTNWQNRKAEERKHLHGMVVNAALDIRKESLERQQKNTEQKSIVLPLHVFVANILKSCDLFLDKKVNKDNVAKKLKEIDDFKDAIEQYFKNKRQ